MGSVPPHFLSIGSSGEQESDTQIVYPYLNVPVLNCNMHSGPPVSGAVDNWCGVAALTIVQQHKGEGHPIVDFDV